MPRFPIEVAGIEVYLQQHIARQSDEQIPQPVIDDNVPAIPCMPDLRQVMRAERLVAAIGFITVHIWGIRGKVNAIPR